MLTTFARIIISIIALLIVSAVIVWFITDQPVIEPVNVPNDEQDDGSSDDQSSSEDVVIPATWSTYEATSNGITLNFRHPTSSNVQAVQEGIYEITYVGPESESNTEITDGYVVTIRLVEAASVTEYATERDIVGEPVDVTRFGKALLRYQTESALSGQLITHYVYELPAQSDYVADLSSVTYGSASDMYEQYATLILQSLTFSAANDSTGLVDRVSISSPMTGETVASPIAIEGEAPGNWFFEATAPVVVVDWDGRIIGESFIEAEGEWMTEELVPFSGSVEYDLSTTTARTNGTVILQRANPSGLPENDAATEVTVELVPSE